MLPISYIKQGTKIVVHCVDAPKTKPYDSFICQTERRQKESGSSHHLLPLTDLHNLPEPNIAGLIFHNARCGSTLLCNMLDTLVNIWVVRESGIINRLLRDEELEDSEKRRLYYAIVKLYSSYARSIGARCALKFSSWCGFYINWLIAQHPQQGVLYLARDPVSVVASLLKCPPGWEVGRWVAVEQAEQSQPLEAQMAMFQGALLRSMNMAVNREGRHWALTYQQLTTSDNVLQENIAQYFGVNATPDELSSMRRCLDFDAKSGEPKKANILENKNIFSQYSKYYENEYQYLVNRSKLGRHVE